MIEVLIIEDEIAAFNYLSEIINSYYKNKINVIGHNTTVKGGIKLIEELNPDLVFLDIQLTDGTGFDILDYFNKAANFEVIFTTGLTDYKEKAMDYFAFYYLNKPICIDKFKNVVDTYLEKKSSFNLERYLAFKNQIENKHTKISLPTNGGSFSIIDVSTILYCEAEGSYTNFYTSENKVFTVSSNLKKVSNLLHQSSFFRIHRSILVNLSHIVKYDNSGSIELSNSKKLVVASRNKANFFRVLKLMNYSIS